MDKVMYQTKCYYQNKKGEEYMQYEKCLEPKLDFVILKLTNLCNLNCYMCGQAYSRSELYKGDLPFDLIKKRLCEIDTVDTVYLFGGEPLLYKDFIPLLELLMNKRINISISTNGTLLDKYTQEIIDNEVRDITVSIDSHQEGTYEKIRGKDSFRSVLNNLKYLIEEKKKKRSKYPKIGINCVILPDNYMKLADFYEFFSREYPEIDYINFEAPRFTTLDMGNKYQNIFKESFKCEAKTWEWYFNKIPMFSNSDLNKIYNQINTLNGFTKATFLTPTTYEGIIETFTESYEIPKKMCYFPFSSFAVLPDGDVTYCVDYPDLVVGNINDESLTQIFNNKKSDKLRNYLIEKGNFPICSRCPRKFNDDDFLIKASTEI